MSKYKEYLITFSAPDTNGFTGETAVSFERELNIIFNSEECIIVQELHNKFGQLFPHYHIYVKYTEEIRQDNLLRNLKILVKYKQLREAYPYHIPNKDPKKKGKKLDARNAHDAHMLIANYLTKQDNFRIIYKNLKKEFEENLMYIAKHKEQNTYVLKGKKCPSLEELPFFIINYNNVLQLGDITDYNIFKQILQMMIKEGYIMIKHYKNIKAVWATILVLEDTTNENDYFNSMIDECCYKETPLPVKHEVKYMGCDICGNYKDE